MTFNDFLRMTTVLRNLYGKQFAIDFFEKNVKKFYNFADWKPKPIDIVKQ